MSCLQFLVSLVLLLCLPLLLDDFERGDLVESLLPTQVLVTVLLFATCIAVPQLRSIVEAPEVATQGLCVGISTRLMLGLLWAFEPLLLDVSSRTSTL